MISRGGTRPPAHLVALIGGITVVPLIILLWLGWRLMEQDDVLERQQIQQRVDRAADLIVSALQRAIAASEQRLASGVDQWPEGAVAVTFRDGRIEASPAGRLAYLPVVPSLRAVPPDAFAHGEELEFRQGDPIGAARAYRPLSQSRDGAVRAGAAMRLGRSLQKAGRVDEALRAYASLAAIDDVAIGEVPAALASAYARGKLFAQANRPSELRTLGAALERDLHSGRWRLTEPAYWLYAADAAAWSGSRTSEARPGEILADSVGTLWERWRATPPRSPSSGREPLDSRGEPVTVLWQASGDTVRALVASSAFAASEWLPSGRAVAVEQHVTFTLNDRDVAKTADGRAARSATDSALPWRVIAVSVQPPLEDGAFARRRRLLIAGFAVLVFLALAASYLIVRAVGRELAVARLQSDFVAAVSHEFRTPLTALRQFTDMLRDHAVLDEDRRRVAYDAQSRATDRLTRLVESLLDFGRMEAGARDYRFEPRDCTELVGRVIDDFRIETAVGGNVLEFRQHEPATVDADEDALARAVRNLLDNAAKYSAAEPIEVGVKRSNGHVRISVRDRGIGIPEAEQRAIFAKFQRGAQARTLGIPGTGIGLAMVDEIVKAHRGHVEVESEPGRGSTFTIVLPSGLGTLG